VGRGVDIFFFFLAVLYVSVYILLGDEEARLGYQGKLSPDIPGLTRALASLGSSCALRWG
jgi:hypothetical protein